MTQGPPIDRAADIQRRLENLAELVEKDSHAVLGQVPELLEELCLWPQRDAYLWCLHITAQAFRFVDELDKSVEAANLGLKEADPDSGMAAGLHLEAGMALNQQGTQSAAEPHLRSAATIFRRLQDRSGLGWSLVALADALCGLARQDEALRLVTEAEEVSVAAGDTRTALRALKQRAVVQRQRGELPDALKAIEAAAGGTTGHARANALLEQGHILAMSQNYVAANDAYMAAYVEYAAHRDSLGLANAERALATMDLILGREVSGLEHLNQAVELYERIGNSSGLGYTLRERSVVRLARGDLAGAHADAREAIRRFDRTGDLLGLSGAWLATARVAQVTGRAQETIDALTRANDVSTRSGNALALAGVRLLQAEIGPPDQRREAGEAAVRLYDLLDIPTGAAHAAAFSARAAWSLNRTNDVPDLLELAATRLRRARRRVVDPGRRADHDLSLRDITATIVEVSAQVGTQSALDRAADALLEDFPLALRIGLMTQALPAAAQEPLLQAQSLGRRSARDVQALRAALRRVAVAVTTLPRNLDQDEYRATFVSLRDEAPDAAVLLVGPPTASGVVPVVHALPRSPLALDLRPLREADVDAIDKLGRVVASGESEILWDPSATRWQRTLGDLLLPSALAAWLESAGRRDLLVVAHPTVAHIPFEALLLPSGRLVGVAAATRRLPVPVPTAEKATCRRLTAFFDPALDWSPEEGVAGLGERSLTSWLEGLAPKTLAALGAHGEAAPGFEGWLSTTDRRSIVTAADILTKRLNGSVVMFEACWSGRHLGHRTGETLNLTTATLLAGAASVIAGLWALPADPRCTGRIAAECIRHLRVGIRPSEALRRARSVYLEDPPVDLQVPGREGARMAATAPWAWAGICAFG